MIYENDWNLLLKIMMPRRVMKHAEDTHNIQDEMNAVRGRASISSALKKELYWTDFRLSRRNGADIDLDLTACFDNIVERYSNLSCRSRGMPKKFGQLHTKVVQHTKHHANTNLGISERYNTHSVEQPIHGSGQGAGDSPTRWILISNGITLGFNKKAKLCSISNPNKTIYITHGPDTFMDDTTMVLQAALGEELTDFVKQLEFNVQLWEELVHATGGELNLSKCYVLLFWWRIDAEGTPHMQMPTDIPVQIPLPSSKNGTTNHLQQRDPTVGERFLGLYPTAIGTTKDQVEKLQTKTTKFVTTMPQIPLEHHGSSLAYRAVYIPTITHPFPATYIEPDKLNHLQQQVTSIFLTAMGYTTETCLTLSYLAPQNLVGATSRTYESNKVSPKLRN